MAHLILCHDASELEGEQKEIAKVVTVPDREVEQRDQMAVVLVAEPSKTLKNVSKRTAGSFMRGTK